MLSYPAAKTDKELSVEGLDLALLLFKRAEPGQDAGIADREIVFGGIDSLAVDLKAFQGSGHFSASSAFEVLEVVESSQALRKVDEPKVGSEALAEE